MNNYLYTDNNISLLMYYYVSAWFCFCCRALLQNTLYIVHFQHSTKVILKYGMANYSCLALSNQCKVYHTIYHLS